MPVSSSHLAWLPSLKSLTMKSRHDSAAFVSIVPVTASAAPGASRASATASPGRSSVFDGMHAQ